MNNTAVKRYASGIVVFAIAASAVALFAAPRVHAAMSLSEIQAQLMDGKEEFQRLQVLVAAKTGQISDCNFSRQLMFGSVGEDVRCLQRFLNATGYTLAFSGAGSRGNETTFYGPRTQAAVMRWQASHGTLASGSFGFGSMDMYRGILARAVPSLQVAAIGGSDLNANWMLTAPKF